MDQRRNGVARARRTHAVLLAARRRGGAVVVVVRLAPVVGGARAFVARLGGGVAWRDGAEPILVEHRSRATVGSAGSVDELLALWAALAASREAEGDPGRDQELPEL